MTTEERFMGTMALAGRQSVAGSPLICAVCRHAFQDDLENGFANLYGDLLLV